MNSVDKNSLIQARRSIILPIAMIMLMVFACSFASAENYIFKQNTAADIKVPCINNGAYCSAISECNLTIIKPDNTLLLDNAGMTNNVAYHNLTLTSAQTAIIGSYQGSVVCHDGTEKGYNSITFDVTRTGENTKGFNSLPIVIALLAVLITLIVLAVITGKNHPLISVALAVIALFVLNPMLQFANLFIDDNFSSSFFASNIGTIQSIISWLSYAVIIYIIVYLLITIISNYNQKKQARLEGTL